MSRATIILLLFAAWPVAGCGPSASERAVQSPEVRQRLLENQKRREAEDERHRMEFEEMKTSTDAALRAAEKLRQETEKAKGNPTSEPSFNRDPKGSADEKPSPPPSFNRDPTGSAVAKSTVPIDDKKALTPTPTTTKNPAAWAQLRAGMTTAAVTTLLGPPTATSQDRTLVYWIYGTGASAGRIAFLNGSGQMVAWEPPAR